MALITLLIPLGALQTSGEIIHYYYLSRVGFPLAALIGPLFYLSIKYSLDRQFKFAAKNLSYFSVSLLELIYLTPYYLSGKAEKLRYIAEDLLNVHFECFVMSQVTFIGNLLFLIATTVFLRKKYNEEKIWFDNRGKKQLRHIKTLLFIIKLFQIFLVSAVVYNPEAVNSNIGTGGISVLVLIIALLVLYHSQTTKADEHFSGIHRYDKDRMSDSDIASFGKKIEAYIENKKIFLDPEYTLIMMANFMELPQNKTSQVINRFFGKSFPDLLNERRVRHAILLMKDIKYREFNLLRIGLESGFNSKSNFNSCFKKVTGTTPREYRKKKVSDLTTGRS